MNIDPNPNANRTVSHFDVGYFSTLPGIIKIIQLVLGIICMACGSPASGYEETYGVGHNQWFLFVSIVAFIITFIWSVAYLLKMREKNIVDKMATAIATAQGKCSWLVIELVFSAAATLFYLIAFIVLLAGFGHCAGESTRCDARIAAGVFGIFNTVAYGVGTYLLFDDFITPPTDVL